MLSEREAESCYLGQFIPAHYHHNMLLDENRMRGFKAAIDYAVFPGAKVLELGGGTGVLSWFAAQKADKVWCVELNPDLIKDATKFITQNSNGHKVEIIHADAFEYLPPEPVDVVICEMIHVAMLREKQVAVIESFKQRYLEKFGGPLPMFIPEAVIMAVQPIQQNFDFFGFHAPIVAFQETGTIQSRTIELANPAIYSMLDFNQSVSQHVQWQGEFVAAQDGTVNALRFITKNILAVVLQTSSTIDWLNHYMVLPLHEPVPLKAGARLHITLGYQYGDLLSSLQHTMRVEIVNEQMKADYLSVSV